MVKTTVAPSWAKNIKSLIWKNFGFQSSGNQAPTQAEICRLFLSKMADWPFLMCLMSHSSKSPVKYQFPISKGQLASYKLVPNIACIKLKMKNKFPFYPEAEKQGSVGILLASSSLIFFQFQTSACVADLSGRHSFLILTSLETYSWQAQSYVARWFLRPPTWQDWPSPCSRLSHQCVCGGGRPTCGWRALFHHDGSRVRTQGGFTASALSYWAILWHLFKS